jgi:hypothetical protein
MIKSIAWRADQDYDKSMQSRSVARTRGLRVPV